MPSLNFANLALRTFHRATCLEGCGQRILWRLWHRHCQPAAFLEAIRRAGVPAGLKNKLRNGSPRAGVLYVGALTFNSEVLAEGPFEITTVETRGGELYVEVAETLLAEEDFQPRWEVHPPATAKGAIHLPASRLPIDLTLSGKLLDKISQAFRDRWSEPREMFPLLLQAGISDLDYLKQLAAALGRAADGVSNAAGFLVGETGRWLRLAFPFSAEAELATRTAADMHLHPAGIGPFPGTATELGMAGAAGSAVCEHWEGMGRGGVVAAFKAARGAALPFRLQDAGGVKRIALARLWCLDVPQGDWNVRFWTCAHGGAWAHPGPGHPVMLRVVVQHADADRWTVTCRPADTRFVKSGATFELALSTPSTGEHRGQGIHLLPAAKEVGLMLWSGELLDFPVWAGALRPVEAPKGASGDIRRLGTAAFEISGVAQTFQGGAWTVKGSEAHLEATAGAIILQRGGRSLSVNDQYVDVG